MRLKKYEVTYRQSVFIGCRSAKDGVTPLYDFIQVKEPITEKVIVEARNKAIAKILAADSAVRFYCGRSEWYLIGEVKHNILRNIISITEVSADE